MKCGMKYDSDLHDCLFFPAIRLALPYGKLNRPSSIVVSFICLIRSWHINSIEVFLLSHPNTIKVKMRRGVAGTILSQRLSAYRAFGFNFPHQNLCVALRNVTMPQCHMRYTLNGTLFVLLLTTFQCVYFSFKIFYACVNTQTEHVCAPLLRFSPASNVFSRCTY